MILYTRKHKTPFQIDDEDLEKVSAHTWLVKLSGGYPTTTLKDAKQVCLHQLLLGKAPDGLQWDHINRDKLDNRKENLRLVTKTVNARNQGLRSDNPLGVKGVYRYFRTCGLPRYMVRIEEKITGRYDTLEEAAIARHKEEAERWGSSMPDDTCWEKVRAEDAKFSGLVPKERKPRVGRSGVPGIQLWPSGECVLMLHGNYIGFFKTIDLAIQARNNVLAGEQK